ncbi:hypothetical protein OG345_05240 [Streptomyces sp. NBC_01220]|uniref:hypothetical protein n=1 Tax=Streptomyces sp. NBC_01220 TaxID=2903781 RepID=UPI00352FE73B|nr:hypothetical protein OG345_05240 [Streptomyces sp. NBC_01220]
MTFEGHTDRAPRVLPRREQGEALLAIQEASPEPPSDAGLDLFAVPAGAVQGGGFDLFRFHRLPCLSASGRPASPSSAGDPQDAA